MTTSTILVIGATGSIGQVVVEQALAQGLNVRALSHNSSRAERILGSHDGLDFIQADPTDASELAQALDGVDAVILTHGGDHDPQAALRTTKACISALDGSSTTRMVLMTSMGVSRAASGPYADLIETKFAGEQALRASGLGYTIVRPGWFDYQSPSDTRVVVEQGDKRFDQSGVARDHVAATLLSATWCDNALGRTVEVFSGPGEPISDWDELWASTQADD